MSDRSPAYSKRAWSATGAVNYAGSARVSNDAGMFSIYNREDSWPDGTESPDQGRPYWQKSKIVRPIMLIV